MNDFHSATPNPSRGRPTDITARLPALEDLRRELARREKLAHYRSSPEAYAAEVLGIRWWSRQIEIARSVLENRRTVVYAGHSVGKTHGVAGLVQWHFDCFSPSITLTTAPNWASIHDLLWGEIKAQRPEKAPGRLLDMKLDGGPMWYAAGHNAETSSGFQGRHEAREDPSWNAIHISCLDHPNIAAELRGDAPPFAKAVSLVWVNEMIAKHCSVVPGPEGDVSAFEFPPGSGRWYLPDDVFRSRVLGYFPRQASNSVFSDEWLVSAKEAPQASRETELQIGVDVARYGDDKSTLYARRGCRVTDRESYSKQDTMETVGRVARLAARLGERYRVDARKILIVVDDTGVGGGVTDRLRELRYNVKGLNFGEKAIRPDEYYNRGSEIWFTLADRARTGRLDLSGLPGDAYRTLSADLRSRRYRIQSDKTLRVESKEEVRKRLGRSPDDADGCVLAFAGVRQVSVVAPRGVGLRRSPWAVA